MKRGPLSLGRGLVLLSVVAVLFLTVPRVLAAEKLSLKDCVRRAVLYNNTLRSYASERRAVAMEVKEALSPFYPTFSFSTLFERSDWEDLPRNDHATIKFKARYNLFRGGGDWALLKTKKHELEASGFDFLEQGLDIVATVEGTYFAILSLKNQLKVLKKSVDAALLHETVAKKRVEAGLAPLSDELRAKVDLANARVDLVQAQREMKTLIHTLAVLMGVPPTEAVDLEKEHMVKEAGKRTLQELFELAKRNRPVLKSYQQQVQKLAWEEKSLKAEFFPVLDAYAETGEEGPDYFPDKEYWTMGLELRYPFFSGFSTKYAVAQTRSKLEAKRWSYRQKILEVQKEIADAYEQLKTDERVIEAQETLLKSALENLKVAQRRYEVGVGSIVELTDARVAATKAAIGLENARLTVVGDEIELKRVTGWFVPVIKEIEGKKDVAKEKP